MAREKPKNQQFSFRLDPELSDGLREVARSHGTIPSRWLRDTLTQAIRRERSVTRLRDLSKRFHDSLQVVRSKELRDALALTDDELEEALNALRMAGTFWMEAKSEILELAERLLGRFPEGQPGSLPR